MKKSGKLFLGGGFLGTENRSAGEGVQTNPHLLQSLGVAQSQGQKARVSQRTVGKRAGKLRGAIPKKLLFHYVEIFFAGNAVGNAR